MAKVILICGKISAGKTHYAKSLLKKNNAVLLSADEITIALFGTEVGEEHNLIVERTQKYLLNKSLEIWRVNREVDKKKKRNCGRKYYYNIFYSGRAIYSANELFQNLQELNTLTQSESFYGCNNFLNNRKLLIQPVLSF